MRRRGGRAVDCGGLENRCAGNRTEGSNPSLSATLRSIRDQEPVIVIIYRLLHFFKGQLGAIGTSKAGANPVNRFL